jgi:hypothetical protein
VIDPVIGAGFMVAPETGKNKTQPAENRLDSLFAALWRID